MKVKEIYETALSFLFEAPNEDKSFKENTPKLLNVLLVEALPYENSIRKSNGQVEAPMAPVVKTLDDEVPFSDSICRLALPYGLCSHFYTDEGDSYRSQDYRLRFIDALNELSKAIVTDTVDEYGSEE